MPEQNYPHDANLVMAFLLEVEKGAVYEEVRAALIRESTIAALDEAKRRFDLKSSRFHPVQKNPAHGAPYGEDDNA